MRFPLTVGVLVGGVVLAAPSTLAAWRNRAHDPADFDERMGVVA